MSTYYYGKTDGLIIAPGESLSTSNSGLSTLNRIYQCAYDYREQAQQILVPGYQPEGYPLMALKTAPIAQRAGPMCMFACQFFGVLSENDYYRFYDVFTTLNQQVTYKYWRWDLSVTPPENVDFWNYPILKDGGTFGYASPILSRSFVVPIQDHPKVPKLDSGAWNGFPVSVFSEHHPDSAYWTGSDILAKYGYQTDVTSLAVTPFGSVNLVQVEYQKLSLAGGQTITSRPGFPDDIFDWNKDETDPRFSSLWGVQGVTASATGTVQYNEDDTSPSYTFTLNGTYTAPSGWGFIDPYFSYLDNKGRKNIIGGTKTPGSGDSVNVSATYTDTNGNQNFQFNVKSIAGILVVSVPLTAI